MAATGLQMLAFDTDTSNNAAVSAMVQEHFLQAVAKSLGVDLEPQDDDAEHEGEEAEDGGDEGDSAADEAVAKAVLAGVELADPVEALHALRRSCACLAFGGRACAHLASLTPCPCAHNDGTVCSTERMVVQVSGDILALPSPRHPWLDAFRDAVQPVGLGKRTCATASGRLTSRCSYLQTRPDGSHVQGADPHTDVDDVAGAPLRPGSHARSPGKDKTVHWTCREEPPADLAGRPRMPHVVQAHVVVLPAIESSFAVHTTRGTA